MRSTVSVMGRCLLATLLIALSARTTAFVPPGSFSSVQRPRPVAQKQSQLYFFGGKKKSDEKEEEQKDESPRIPFFSRLLERDTKPKEEESTEEPSPQADSKDETSAEESPAVAAEVSEPTPETAPVKDDSARTVSVVSKVDTPEPPKKEEPPKVEIATKEESPAEKARALKAQAERIRLEAEKMDAQLTLDKIERLERELAHARKKGEGVEELQKEMEDLQAKMRGEAPKPRTAPEKPNSSTDKPMQSSSQQTLPVVSTTTEAQPVDEENFQKYIKEWEKAPAAMKSFMAGMVGLYGSDVENINGTEVALRMEMRDRSDFSFIQGPKPEFTKEQLDEVKRNPLFKLTTMQEKASDDEIATKILEEQYYTELLASQYSEAGGDESFFEIEIFNMTELDTMTESLFPKSTRKEGQAPTMSEAMTLISDVLPQAGFNPSGKPEQVLGGYIIRGTSKMDSGDKLVDSIDAKLARSSLRGRVSVFYIKDYTVFTEEQLESPGFSPVDAEPILLVTGPNVAPDRRRILLSAVSAFGIASSWYLSIYPFLLNPDLMKRAEEQMQLANADMAYDLTWLTDLSLPLFATFIGVQLAHEVGHRAVAGIYGMNVTIPTFIPSLITGMTSTVTMFKDPPKNREAMFDFSIAGPLTGIAAALLAMYLGLELTIFSTAEAYAQFPALPLEILRQSTLGGGLVEFILGRGSLAVPAGAEGTSAIANINIPLHPVAIAGYIGLVVNALALLPIGTTDGGRISLTLFSRGAKIVVGQVFLFLLLVFGIFGSDLLLFYFSFVVFFQRGNEIPARNEVDDVSFSRVLVATFAGVVTLLALTPIS